MAPTLQMCFGRSASIPAASSRARSRPICRWCSRASSNWLSTTRPPGCSPSPSHRPCSPLPTNTLLYVSTANASYATLFGKLNFNFIRDIASVAAIIRVPNLVSVNLSLPVKTVPQLIAHAKANPGKLNFGAPNGGTVQLSGELFKMMTGVNIVHVPYSNQMQAVTDLIVGQIQVIFDVMPTTLDYARAVKLPALAVTTATRSPALPDVPSVGDFVPGYEASSWHGVGVPKNTPVEIVAKLNKEINAGLADPTLKARLADLGGVPMPMTPADFGQFIAAETEKWGKVGKFAGLKPE